MFRIVNKKELNSAVTLLEIEALFVAKKAKAGQFIIFRVDEFSERVPLTIADYDREKGTVTIIFQKVGLSRKRLCYRQAEIPHRSWQPVRRCHCHRPYPHDEICQPHHKTLRHQDHCQPEPHHDRRYRHVRRLSCHRWRRTQICLRRRPRLRRTSGGL